MAPLVEMRKQKALLSLGVERDFYIFSIPTWKNKNPRAGNSYECSELELDARFPTTPHFS